MKKIHILLTGGGTGGHIYPLIAVAEELKHTARQHNLELHLKFLGAPSNFQTVLEGYGIDVSKTVSSKLRRYFSLLNLLEPFKFIIGFIQAIIKLYFIMPNVIFSKSGPGTVPIVLAAWFYRIPIIIHESDAECRRSSQGIRQRTDRNHYE